METNIDFDLSNISNLKAVFENQLKKFQTLRNLAKELHFIPVEPIGSYSPISFASYDGGKMGIEFNPFQLDFIEVADSYGNEPLKFLLPTNQPLHIENLRFLEKIPEIQNLLDYLNSDSIADLCQFPPNTNMVMELAEIACIFTKLSQNRKESILVLKDGLLRNKFLTYQQQQRLKQILKDYPKRKLIGIAKKSKILDTIQALLLIEKIIPKDQTGFIPLPLNIEEIAYKWPVNISKYPFGKLFIAKLSPKSNLLLTVEIPYDFANEKEIYTENELKEIFGCLIKDSQFSFPTLGYPQTIMRAHEKAARTGFTASIWREKIIKKLLEELKNKELELLLRENRFNLGFVDKRFLGGV